MIILGIHDGHNSGASLFKDGKLLSALSEEKISRKKNEYGFPIKSINSILKHNNISKSQIDSIAVSTKNLPPKYYLVKRNTSFSLHDYIKEQNDYWYKKIYENKNVKYLDVFKKKILGKKKLFYDFSKIKNEDDFSGMQMARKKFYSKYFSLDEKKIFFFDHHECHAYYGYYGRGVINNKTCVITLDGGGDGSNATIWISKNEILKNVYRTNIGNLGRMYRYITLILGMKPTEHEFKVMGLAGYALEKSEYYQKSLKIFKETLGLKGIKFKYKKKIKDNYFYFKKKLSGERFDTISYAIQKYLEDILLEWFGNISKKYNIKDFIFSGGVAQNVKATKKILESKNISSIYVPPGPGDESLSIGAVYCFLSKNRINQKISDMQNPYVGISFKDSDLDFIKKIKNVKIKKTTYKEVANILAKGNPIARFSLEPNEFGPRALGNRSILADPRKQDIINLINKKIKVRDFWMPFAPSILEGDAKKIMHVIKNHKNPYMTISFDVKQKYIDKISAAVHPFDKTCRPQFVSKKINPEYYNLIKEFKKITNIGVLLNTSFNLHGEPIVFQPKDAIKSFLKSGLKYLYIGKYLIKKTNYK
ncbi:carbamoyltransferase C-terminal domain-containing protein [Candidatus Pelagibacter bacterium nBUS_25]|uniref:carbamoyltransferase C-terminal domain-containing protein n=1 Tax=Candidatus Pelagibacter bacterium nBUS_25 TaxID=3374187 RepID=UPI003EBB2CAF